MAAQRAAGVHGGALPGGAYAYAAGGDGGLSGSSPRRVADPPAHLRAASPHVARGGAAVTDPIERLRAEETEKALREEWRSRMATRLQSCQRGKMCRQELAEERTAREAAIAARAREAMAKDAAAREAEARRVREAAAKEVEAARRAKIRREAQEAARRQEAAKRQQVWSSEQAQRAAEEAAAREKAAKRQEAWREERAQRAREEKSRLLVRQNRAATRLGAHRGRSARMLVAQHRTHVSMPPVRRPP